MQQWQGQEASWTHEKAQLKMGLAAALDQKCAAEADLAAAHESMKLYQLQARASPLSSPSTYSLHPACKQHGIPGRHAGCMAVDLADAMVGASCTRPLRSCLVRLQVLPVACQPCAGAARPISNL